MDVEDDNSRRLNRQCAKLHSQIRKAVIGYVLDYFEHLIMLALVSVQRISILDLQIVLTRLCAVETHRRIRQAPAWPSG